MKGRSASRTTPADPQDSAVPGRSPHINLRHLRYFVAVAEELHFARAAARLNMAQPPLSQQIQRLELELQVRLLDRSGRKIKLTESGQVFLTDARRILAELERARQAAQRASRGELGELVVGVMSNGNPDLFRKVLPRFRDRHPGVNVAVRSMNTATQIEALRSGQIDVGILRLPIDAADIATLVVAREDLHVALAAGHKLARAKKVLLAEVAQYPQVMFARRLAPAYYDLILDCLRRENRAVEVVQEVEHLPTQLGLISCEYGVALLPESVRAIRFPNVVNRPVADAGFQVQSGLAYLTASASRVVSEFKATFEEVLAPCKRASRPD